MAQKTTIQLIDDIDGTEAAETLTFALDGVTYEIDLSDEHAGQLRETLASWIDAGRRVGGRTQRGKAATTKTISGYDPKAVRAWAASNGVNVPARGRIPNAVVEQFRAAGN